VVRCLEVNSRLKTRLLRSRATSPAKFANALNYSRSLALILDKTGEQILFSIKFFRVELSALEKETPPEYQAQQKRQRVNDNFN
ncbi:MAG: hypothetical protein ACR2N3_10710, partial [Pyrinomonadaceae bacterium]